MIKTKTGWMSAESRVAPPAGPARADGDHRRDQRAGPGGRRVARVSGHRGADRARRRRGRGAAASARTGSARACRSARATSWATRAGRSWRRSMRPGGPVVAFTVPATPGRVGADGRRRPTTRACFGDAAGARQLGLDRLDRAPWRGRGGRLPARDAGRRGPRRPARRVRRAARAGRRVRSAANWSTIRASPAARATTGSIRRGWASLDNGGLIAVYANVGRAVRRRGAGKHRAVIALALTLALAAPSSDEAYRFAVSLVARRGRGRRRRRPSGEAHQRVAARFRAVGLRVGYERFSVPGKGMSRDVIGIRDSPARLPGDRDGAHRQRPARAGRRRQRVRRRHAGRAGALAGDDPAPACDVWLVATGAEERPYTGTPNHLGASALVSRLQKTGRLKDVRLALSLDEVGRGTRFDLHSTASAVGGRWSGGSSTRARPLGARSRRARATPTTASSPGRARRRRSSAWSTSPAATPRATRPTGSSAARSRAC